MSIKLSKSLLFFILSLTLINIIYFSLKDSPPDNLFVISSADQSFNWFEYSLTSFLATISYFLGPFTIFSFVFFLVLYPLYFQKREKLTDIITFFLLLSTTALFSYFIDPVLLGDGIRYFFDNYLSKPVVILFFFSSTLLLCIGLASWSFKNLFNFFDKIFSLIQSKFILVYRTLKGSSIKTFRFIKNPSEEIFSKVSESLKGEEGLSDLVSIEEDENEEDDLFFEEEQEEEHDFEEDPECLEKENKNVISSKKVRKRTKGAKYFAEESLIKSIEVKNRGINLGPDQSYFESIIQCLEEKISDFKISGKIINVLKGPVVDTFELELGPGVKVSKVTGITEDLSLALSGAPIRMIYPLMGKTTMGIEVPRNPREIIYLSDVLKSKEFKSANLRLPIAMGKDAFGKSRVVDLAAMPHMLVAGATGAGKSVFINTLLVSLLVKLDPKKLKLILIDPKQLELALYAKLPHLILPVMTEAKTASISLLWATQEMERRYSILKEMGVRNVEGYNKKIKTCSSQDLAKVKSFFDFGETDFELPYIVIIVDEFADLILTKVGKDIEINICRLAAKARASGIHLVLATQRPSVDVITGLVKSNFPSRVSFRVTSSTDSRTILNSMGAEKLLGKGDMLLKQGIEMHRLHSAYVDEDDIEKLIDKMCTVEPEFHQGALDFIEQVEEGDMDADHFSEGVQLQQTLPNMEGKDAYYKDAVEIVRETRAASASMLQRRLKIGYNRAANLIDQLEKDRIVGPQQGSKPREVF